MRRPVLLIFVNAMILMVVFTLLLQSLVIVRRLAVAQSVTGKVEVQRSGRGDYRALASRDMIKTGDVIRSGLDGTAEFKWADGTRWKMLPNTELTIKKAAFNAVKRTEQCHLMLRSGKVFVRITKSLSPASQFEVETPTTSVAVRGTIFSVGVQNSQTSVAVFKGEVQVKGQHPNNTTIIESGEALISDGTSMYKQSDQKEQAAFAQQISIIKPYLQANLGEQEGNEVLVKGETEAGNEVMVNDQKLKVLGNGVFRKSVSLPADGKFVIVSTDKHGVASTIVQTLNVAHSKVTPVNSGPSCEATAAP